MLASAKLTYVMPFKWFAVKIRLHHLASSSTFTHRSIWGEIIQYAQMNRKLFGKRKKRLSFSASETQEIKTQHWGFDLITLPRGLIPRHCIWDWRNYTGMQIQVFCAHTEIGF